MHAFRSVSTLLFVYANHYYPEQKLKYGDHILY